MATNAFSLIALTPKLSLLEGKNKVRGFHSFIQQPFCEWLLCAGSVLAAGMVMKTTTLVFVELRV